MNGEIAQLVALVCHLNHACATGSVQPFFPSHSTCSFCDRISFLKVRPRFLRQAAVEEYGQTPDEWMRRMIDERVLGARAQRVKRDRQGRVTVGFVGRGGALALETLQADGHSALWLTDWSVWNQSAPDKRICRVSYTSGRTEPTELGDAPDVEARATQLREALIDIQAFSESAALDAFTDMFRKAVAALSGDDIHGYHLDLAPTGILTGIELRLLDACQLAWVFGGMGSWNDFIFEGTVEERYQAVTDRLFTAVNAGISAAVNGWVHRRRA